MKERLLYSILGFLIGIIFLLLIRPEKEMIEYKVPVKFKEIKKEVKILKDEKIKKDFERIVDSLQKELVKVKNEKRFEWQIWKYEDKHLKAQIDYWGLLKNFNYEIKKRDTLITFQKQIKKDNFWKGMTLGIIAGGVFTYFVLKR